jgi:hypothetical protein
MFKLFSKKTKNKSPRDSVKIQDVNATDDWRGFSPEVESEVSSEISFSCVLEKILL